MPTYQYACTACAERHEAVQAFTDAALEDCPACGGRLRKVFSAVGVVFKGSGFYKNDSRKPAAGGDKPAEKGKPDGPGKADGPAKTETAAKAGGSAKSDGASAASSPTTTPAAKTA